MKILSLTKRLSRDFKNRELANLSADDRLELLDAINAGIQRLYGLSPAEEKITSASIALAAPTTVMLTVTNGSAVFGGYGATLDDLYCTVRVTGDPVDNQIASNNEFLHPYAGATGTVQAVIYHDAAILPEPVTGIIGEPKIVENGVRLISDPSREILNVRGNTRPVGQPRYWWIEANARNQNPTAPAVFRVDTLPAGAIRIESQVGYAPVRFTFADLVNGTAAIPFREEVIEGYLIPIIRGELADTSLWRDSSKVASIVNRAEKAESEYVNLLVTSPLSTPCNRVGSAHGF